jgi:hypothetical protein
MSEVERRFAILARMSEVAAETQRDAERAVEFAQARFDELMAQPTLDAEARAELERSVEQMLNRTRTQLANIVKQLDLSSEVIQTVDPQEPEQLGILVAEGDATESLAATFRAEVAILRLIHEVKRKLAT